MSQARNYLVLVVIVIFETFNSCHSILFPDSKEKETTFRIEKAANQFLQFPQMALAKGEEIVLKLENICFFPNLLPIIESIPTTHFITLFIWFFFRFISKHLVFNFFQAKTFERRIIYRKGLFELWEFYPVLLEIYVIFLDKVSLIILFDFDNKLYKLFFLVLVIVFSLFCKHFFVNFLQTKVLERVIIDFQSLFELLVFV